MAHSDYCTNTELIIRNFGHEQERCGRKSGQTASVNFNENTELFQAYVKLQVYAVIRFFSQFNETFSSLKNLV